MSARAALSPLAALAFGCAWLSVATAPRIGECGGPLVPAAAIPGGDFALHERVRIAGEGVDLGLELLVERRGDRLVVVGLNAFGARVFSLVQQGDEITERDAPLGRALPVPPENVLRDLHAARFSAPETPDRVELRRPGCGYTATFVRVDRRELPQDGQSSIEPALTRETDQSHHQQ
jgi:hypothetical protein